MPKNNIGRCYFYIWVDGLKISADLTILIIFEGDGVILELF